MAEPLAKDVDWVVDGDDRSATAVGPDFPFLKMISLQKR